MNLRIFYTRKIRPYLFPVSILFIGGAIIWIWIFPKFDPKGDRFIPILVSSFGLVFGIFQVALNIAINQIKDKNKLRFSEFKEIGLILSGISDHVNNGVLTSIQDPDELNVNEFLRILWAEKNSYKEIIVNTNDFLFPKLDTNELAIKIREKILEIYSATNELNKGLKKAEKEKFQHIKPNAYEEEKLRLYYNWRTIVTESNREFNSLKYKFLNELKEFFK